MNRLLVFLLQLCPIWCNLTEIQDLTWSFNNETIYWTGVTPFQYIKKIGTVADRGFWYAANEFKAGEHGGTHFDAPYHFAQEGWKVAKVPLSRLIAKGATIDLSATENVKSLEIQHLNEWVRTNGEFEENTVLVVRFGWSKLWPNRTNYLGIDPEEKYHFPGLSQGAAQWVQSSGKIVGVALDTASVDPGDSTHFHAHRILAKAGIYVVENVKLLEKLPAKDFTLIVMPMKLQDGSGAPVRIVAVPKSWI